MIRVEHLDVRLGRSPVLHDVTFSADVGVTGVVGVNGAGKTTLLRAIAGAVRHRAGTIEPEPHAGRTGLAPQIVPVTGAFTSLQYLRYLAALDGLPVREAKARAAQVLRDVDLEGEASKRTARLSGGMRKRLGIAQALLREPPVLLLDEPTTGLDPIQRRQILDLVADLGRSRSILMSTHSLADIVDVTSRYVLLAAGRVVQVGETGELPDSGQAEDALERLLTRRGLPC